MRYQCHNSQFSVSLWSSEESFPIGVGGIADGAPTCQSEGTSSHISSCDWETPAESFADATRFNFPSDYVPNYPFDPEAKFILIDSYTSPNCGKDEESYTGSYMPIIGRNHCLQNNPSDARHKFIISKWNKFIYPRYPIPPPPSGYNLQI